VTYCVVSDNKLDSFSCVIVGGTACTKQLTIPLQILILAPVKSQIAQ
jgi:hypothetical protein